MLSKASGLSSSADRRGVWGRPRQKHAAILRPMLSAEQIREFDENGFLLIPNVVSKERVAELRSYLIDDFDGGERFQSDTPALRADLCARHPETRDLLWNEKMVGPLRSLLGDDFVYLPEMAAHSSFFSTWHKDTQSQESAGHEFHWNDDYLMVEAAIYLQDNNELGGGLEVVPGSHMKRRRVETRLQRILTRLKRLRPYSIPSKAGDLVFFHYRIDHRASKPRLGKKAPTGADRKVALFFGCSRNNVYVRDYIEFLKSYGPMSYVNEHEYPPELVAEAERNSLTLAPA